VLLNRYCPWFYSTAPVFTARTTHRSCVQCGECGTDTILPLQHPQQTPASESLSFTLSNIQIQCFTLPGNRCREPHVRLLEPSSAAPLPPHVSAPVLLRSSFSEWRDISVAFLPCGTVTRSRQGGGFEGKLGGQL
jgi:hypothetical protein